MRKGVDYDPLTFSKSRLSRSHQIVNRAGWEGTYTTLTLQCFKGRCWSMGRSPQHSCLIYSTLFREDVRQWSVFWWADDSYVEPQARVNQPAPTSTSSRMDGQETVFCWLQFPMLVSLVAFISSYLPINNSLATRQVIKPSNYYV